MKKIMLLFVLVYFAQMFSATYTVDGYAFLEGETDHSGIQVFFQRVAPDTFFSYTVYTDSLGYYSKSVEGGYYDVEYSKTGFGNIIIEDAVLYSDQTIADKTLLTQGLEGSIKGILHAGIYNVTDTLIVLEGDSLVIEPGVVLNFSAKSLFLVKGYLKAEGNESDSIYFDSAADMWNGIAIDNLSSGSVFTYCSINSTSSYALRINNPDHDQIISINNTYINTNVVGIYVSGIGELNLENVILHGKKGSGDFRGIDCHGPINIILNRCQIINFAFGVYATDLTPPDSGEISVCDSYVNSYGCIYVENWEGELSIYNSTFIADDIGVYNSTLDFDSYIQIHNCIISKTTADAWYNTGIRGYSENIVVNNSNVFGFEKNYDSGAYIGIIVTTNANGDPCDAYGNISMDPKFKDSINGDFGLLSDSPCIDAGTNTIDGYTFPVADLRCCVRIWDGDSNGSTIVDMGAYEYGAPVGIEEQSVEVNDFNLYQNYPNPFNPITTISYALPKAAQAELNVYNLNGQLIQSLFNGNQDKGIHKAEFNAGNLTSGMYFYSLKVDGKSVQSRKMMMLK